jgi:hypothetical protein
MLFMTLWKTPSGNRDKALERFLKTGGSPPAGIKLIGRWHSVTQGRGVVISETDDAELIAKWCLEWSDLLEFEVVPVLDDSATARILTP